MKLIVQRTWMKIVYKKNYCDEALLLHWLHQINYIDTNKRDNNNEKNYHMSLKSK